MVIKVPETELNNKLFYHFFKIVTLTVVSVSNVDSLLINIRSCIFYAFIKTYLESQMGSTVDSVPCLFNCVVFREVSSSVSRLRSQSIVKLSTVNLLGSNFPDVSSTRFSSKVNLIGDAGRVL